MLLRRTSNGSLSCQSSVISSLDVSLEECIIGGDNITDTDSGFHQAPRARIPSGSSESNTPRSDDETAESSATPSTASAESSPAASPTQKIKSKMESKIEPKKLNQKLTRRRNSEILKECVQVDSDSS